MESNFDWGKFRRNLDVDETDIKWDSAEELSRLSIGSLLGEIQPIRRDFSSGFLRFTGAGVRGHNADLNDVSEALKNFQRFVSATGASISGFKTLQGRIPLVLESKTALDLQGSALPGSLILQFSPRTMPSAEIFPEGQTEIFNDGEDQLVDLAVGKSIEILNDSKNLEPDADNSDFLAKLEESGPRVATSLKSFAESLIQGNFEPELVWKQPRKKASKASLLTPELVNLSQLVVSRKLDKENRVIAGKVRTASDLGPFKIEDESGKIQTVIVDNIEISDISKVFVGMNVVIHCTVEQEIAPGGEVKVTINATRIELP